MSIPPAHRILTIDDNAAIHEDFRKLFAVESAESRAFDAFESQILGGEAKPLADHAFDLDFASQGQEGLEKVRAALAADRPFALAFVDMRMPPGWDGVETIEHLWKADPDLQVVICTAYSDHSWADIRRRLGNSDNVLVLKKPFDNIEALQIAHALTRKWELARLARRTLEDLDRKVAERTEAVERERAERARAEDNLRQAQKIEAVGQLAAGVAHDFNNLLTVIKGNVSLLMSPEGPVNPTDSLKQIARAADRAADLTRQLLLFSRKEAAAFKSIDLNEALGKTGELLRRVIGEQIELRLVQTESPAVFSGDECSLDQIIMNLAINGRDAMPDGGVLTLRASIENLDSESARRHPRAGPGSFVCLTVSDTGCGMDAATLNQVFEPFFTTKGTGKGTGLGLATVYGIVQRHDGWIEVDSEPGKGTRFRVFLPLQNGPATASVHAEITFRPPPQEPDQFTVLVVEDEPAVREFVTTVLRLNSYRVVEATDGLEALEMWSRHAGQVDLLFTDMVMPNGLSGRDLAEKLQSESPSLKVVYSSGYSAETVGNEWLKEPGIDFLAKPYTVAALLRSVSSSVAHMDARQVA
jgi:two-component system, NtrC family, sensor kinase